MAQQPARLRTLADARELMRASCMLSHHSPCAHNGLARREGAGVANGFSRVSRRAADPRARLAEAAEAGSGSISRPVAFRLHITK